MTETANSNNDAIPACWRSYLSDKAQEKAQAPSAKKRHPKPNLRSMPYRAYLKTKHWSRLRSRMLKKYDRRCGLCGSGGSLNVHHVDYGRRGREKPSDLILLCADCHHAHHEGRHEDIVAKLDILQVRGGVTAKAKEIAETLVPMPA